MLDEQTEAAVRDAVERVFTGRERVPGDLPYPPSITDYVLLAAWPDEDPKRQRYTKPGRELSRAARQTYVAGWFAGRACDEQITRQLRDWFGPPPGPHPHIGVGACLVCDGPPHPVAGREPTGGAA